MPIESRLNLHSGDIVFVDTAPFIYFFENHPDYLPIMQDFFEQVYDVQAQVVTSMVTYIELTSQPVRLGDRRLARKYRDYLCYSENITLLPLDLTIADEVVALRAEYALKTPDAVQLGTALAVAADYVLTNDRQWSQVEELRIVQLSDWLGSETDF
jgi:predicted nucleic acid-binding protein